MTALGNDRFRGSFVPARLGTHHFVVRARVEQLATMLANTAAKRAAELDLSADLAVVEAFVRAAAARAPKTDRAALVQFAEDLAIDGATLIAPAASGPLQLAARYGEAHGWATSARRALRVERELAAFSSWYELFPRSTAPTGFEHGRFNDVEARLDYIAGLGFDIVYLPPIHPIGFTNRKGKFGAPGGAGDPGSPWAIGSSAGGHTAVEERLGTLEDFDHLVAAAAERDLEIALDLALQCSPDHPWVTEHPQWFRHRPDGTIAYAENPPKRYEDVFPLDFDTEDWRALWAELRAVVEFWISHGVSVFRVDNPHTKPFRFWEWLIGAVQDDHPEVVFLSEAFTRPQVMYHLAKLGFSQSYTYFTWRETKAELTTYLDELTKPDVAAFFRPNFWPNTPDILREPLTTGGPAAFALRAVLAATLVANFGVYGPVFELAEDSARAGSDEYSESEKYEIRHFDFDPLSPLAVLLRKLNGIRHRFEGFRSNHTLLFHGCDNEALIAYSKSPSPRDTTGPDRDLAPVVTVVNLDPHHAQSGWVHLDGHALGLPAAATYAVEDLLTGARFRWRPGPNFVILDPAFQPAHVLAILREDGPA
jgi:starch synthase (maltosyl-transferring)